MTHPTVHSTPDEAARRGLVDAGDPVPEPVRLAPNFLDGDEPSTASVATETTLTDEADQHIPVPSVRLSAPCALGLALGLREVGYAVAGPEQLGAFGILNIGKLTTPESKESRFRSLILNYLDVPQVRRIALVEPFPGIAGEGLIVSLLAWLNQVGVERTVAIDVFPYAALMRAHGTDAQPATIRTLGTNLARRFRELRPFTPEAELPVRGHQVPDFLAQKLPRFASPRERYWSRGFLALAAALHASNVGLSAPAMRPVA
jgi:hypothetical protein